MAIELLESPEELQRILESLGEKHRKFCLTTEHFEMVNDVLTDLIEDRLKSGPAGEDAELAEAWRLCVTSVIAVIKDSATANSATAVCT